jgi:succinate dehydrogenase / fumarate reductase, cytochrome b subunit
MSQSKQCNCFFRSAIAIKIAMAVTGLILFGFVLVHMLGNLQIFLPPEAINHYAYVLKSNPLLLWGARLFLLLTVALHIGAAIALTRRNREARPQAYAKMNTQGATLASRTMFVGGLVLLAFIVFHLLQFTAQVGPFSASRSLEASLPGVPTPVHDVHAMVIQAFQNGWVVLFYLVALVFLALHLNHGGAALFRSLGLGNKSTFGWQNFIARAFAWIVFLGMVAVPLAVYFGAVK